jgi:acylphosphatase
VRGRVQGVAFRAFVRQEARRLGVTGWVRNRDDGAVELEATGDSAKLAALVERLRQGPPLARVTELRQESVDHHPEWTEFRIVYR